MLTTRKKDFPSSLLSNFFEDDWFERSFFSLSGRYTIPNANIIEEADKYQIELLVPAFEKEDIKIDLHNNILTVSAEKKYEKEEKGKKFLHREFTLTSFKRSFTLPDTVDIDKIEAKHHNGVLSISIPKKEIHIEKAPRIIEIK